MKYTIIEALVDTFEEKIKKYAKKFEKYGVCEYLKSNPYLCEDEDCWLYGYNVVDIEVNANYKVGDYEFVAALEWVEEVGENLIKKASDDVYIPEIYKTRRECDHCKTNRYRKSTIILKNRNSEEYIQVGKGCVRDYTGIDLGRYASYLSFYKDLEDYLYDCTKSGIQRIKPLYKVNEVLSQTMEHVKRHGYISKAKSLESDASSTAYDICTMFFEVRNIVTGELLIKKYENLDNQEQVDEVLDFYKDIEVTNDYVGNIKTILQTEWVNGDKIGLIVSAVGTKLRIENERKERENKPVSEYIGQVGDKIKFVAKPVCTFSGETQYGWCYIYKMEVDGNEIVWKTSKGIDSDLTYEFSATIKEHKEYRGTKQTVITRARTKEVA